jgi:uncharacterized membrane protein HdeD (DUF308 family)
MLTAIKIRTYVLAIHGSLAIGLGLAFLYLHAVMTNLFFEAAVIVVAIMLLAGALLLAAISEWFAAFSEWMKHVHRVIFQLLAGIAFAFVGFSLGYYPQITLQWLVVFAAIYAVASGISAFSFAFKAKHHPRERRVMYIFGTASVLFSGMMAGLSRNMDNPLAIALLGAYLCLVGTKMLFFAWDFHRIVSMTERLSSRNGHNDNILSPGPSRARVVKL